MASKCAVECAVFSFTAVLITGIILIAVAMYPSRNYNVAIDSFSGLDLPPSSKDDLNLQFNLTLRFTSTNPFRHECVGDDTYIQVSYRCTPLAIAKADPSHRLCVGPKKSTEGRFVVEGTSVRLPGTLMDSLAADMRSGIEAFNVRIIGGGALWVQSCGARRVGDGGDSCDGWDMCAPRPDKTASDAVIFYTPTSIPIED